MSKPSATPSVLGSRSPDLQAVAAMLTEAAQALLHSGKAAESAAAQENKPGSKNEIRCYRFSPLAIRMEQELLAARGAENLQGLLFEASSSLTAFTALLETMDEEAALEGFAVHILARELKRVENLLVKIQDVYSTVEPVEA